MLTSRPVIKATVQRMEHDAEEAFQCYHRMTTELALDLQIREGGPAILKHCAEEKVAMWR